jgi:hypothetical protein
MSNEEMGGKETLTHIWPTGSKWESKIIPRDVVSADIVNASNVVTGGVNLAAAEQSGIDINQALGTAVTLDPQDLEVVLSV